MTAADLRPESSPNGISAGRALDALENLPGAFLTLDGEGRVTYANAEAERLYGLSRRDLLGRTPWERFADGRGALLERELKRSLAERASVEFDSCEARRCFHVKAWPESD